MACRLHLSNGTSIDGSIVNTVDVRESFAEAMDRCVPLRPAGNPLEAREMMTWTDLDTGLSHMIHGGNIFWLEELEPDG